MGFAQNGRYVTLLLIIFTICFAMRFQQLEAMRPLEGDGLLVLQALPRGTVTPSKASPCTYISGRNKGGHCTLKEMNVAGRGGSRSGRKVAPPAFPDFIVEAGAAASAGSEEKNRGVRRS
ncbi:hypothetical protein Nepgr_032675 [Nepenthes gracilis]|uniref:Uncharacterized protein n=1 Tax=Nepenthes gracilis TaxID=150966 RepID=A0AAD3TJW8_NEPGR|nr:hypothetical protein Nepgr_032675 [Nepenthes gracilis]